MKMIRAIIRPETAEKVADELAIIHPALTKMHVFGRGKGQGILVMERYLSAPLKMSIGSGPGQEGSVYYKKKGQTHRGKEKSIC